MGQLRIRWGWLARGLGALAAALVALQVLPGLLAPPETPPLAADVGLPRVGKEQRVEVVPPERAVRAPDPRPSPKPRTSQGVSAATAVIGSTPRRRRAEPRRKTHAQPPRPTPPPAPAPPPTLESVPVAPAPAPPPTPPPAPEDGSLEFAPH